MRLSRALTLMTGAACTALAAGVLTAGSALAADHQDKPRPMVSLTLPTAQVTFGQESVADLIVSVPPAPGGPDPTGVVAVESPETGGSVCQGQLPMGATTLDCHLGDSFLHPGEYHLFAVYGGDANYFFSDSSASPLQFIVSKQPTTTALTLPASPLAFDQQGGAQMSFQVNATVNGTPTGSVTVTEGSTTICTGNIANGAGTCALATGALSPGTHQLTATYSSDTDFAGSSDTQALTITKPSATTALTLSAARVIFGQEQTEHLSVQVTATSGGVPTGQVTISAGSTILCPAITLANGAGGCNLSVTKLRPGIYHVTATYGGDGGHDGSTSGSMTLAVASEPTSTTLTLSQTKVKFGQEQTEHLTVTVKPRTSGTPAGKVTIMAGATQLCTITLAKGTGSCNLTASKLSPGVYSLTASYGGGTPYAKSTSPKKTLTVTN